MSKNIKLLEKMTFIILEGLIKIRSCRCRTRNEERSPGIPVPGRAWDRLPKAAHRASRAGASESTYMEILEDASTGITQCCGAAVVFGQTLF